MNGSRVVKAEKDNADTLLAHKRQDLAEIQIKCQYDPVLTGGLEKDLAVGQAMETFIRKVKDVVA